MVSMKIYYITFSHLADAFIQSDLQGIVHPKMKFLSLITHPHVVPNLYKFIS